MKLEGKKIFNKFMDLKFYFEDLFSRNVDLGIETSIKPQLRANIMGNAVYA